MCMKKSSGSNMLSELKAVDSHSTFKSKYNCL